jgi:ATP-dependent DNA helicase RecG
MSINWETRFYMSTAQKKSAPKKSPLGRVSSLGPKEPWQSALLLPKEWDDLRNPIVNFGQEFADGEYVVVRGQLNGQIQTRFQGGPPRMSGSLVDGAGQRVFFSAFGDSRELQASIEQSAADVVIFGQTSLFNGMVWLRNIELIDSRWLGRIRPRYLGKPRVINPETVRDRVVGLLREAIPKAASEIAKELGKSPEDLVRFAGIDGLETLERIILHAHIPKSFEQGAAAQEALERMAAYRAITIAREQAPDTSGIQITLPRDIGDWRYWSDKLPFNLSPKQDSAITEIVDDLRQPQPMRRLLSGDVGYGKTAVFAVAAASIYGAGGRVAILLPNETLAEQAAREIKSFWPEVAGDLQLVTGNTDQKEDLTAYRWLIGTTALLFREVGDFHFVVVDEQQKFSRDQRESLLKVKTHLLEATATCIPRSQALIQFGGFSATILDEPPIPRDIKTSIRYAEEKANLFGDVKETLNNGDQVLVVYPRKSKGKDEEEQGIHDVEAAAAAWEKFCPGDVRSAHSERSEEENEKALKDMREGVAKVLVATTVVEVGVNIPRLRRVIIVHPHRFGLSTLHQIRGRAARTGGVGYCDLYLPDPPKEKSLERLRVLEKTQNGFEVAREDLILRGCGDLSSNSSQQTGADETILFGRPLTPQRLEEAARMEEKLWQ